MSPSSLKTLRDAIKRRSFDGAYYIIGEDEYQKDEAVRQLVEAAIEPAARDFNLDVRRGSELDAEALQRRMGGFEYWSRWRGALQIGAFVANVCALTRS